MAEDHLEDLSHATDADNGAAGPPLLNGLVLGLDRDQESAPLYRQVYEGLVTSIEKGWIKPGERLPSTRQFAQELGVSRNTVMLAFDQLTAEGLVEGQAGAGTFVSFGLPTNLRPVVDVPRLNPALRAAGGIGSQFETECTLAHVPPTLRYMRRPVPFRANFPALDAFPVSLWLKEMVDLYRSLDTELANHLLGEGDPQGLHALRVEITEHIARTRGLVCAPSNVIVFAGAQQAVDLACRLLILPGDKVICEDPGYDGIYASATAAGGVPIGVPVDSEGLDVSEAMRRAPEARMAYASPSKQFPLGMTMSLARRMALVEWARQAEAWIIEDDYDCEFRYRGRALPTLYSLDQADRVIYVGTFSKSLFPALRLGYAILPDALIEAMVSARTVVGRYSPILEQALVARFMKAGHFSRHLRRMRKLYAERQAHLVAAIRANLSDYMDVSPTETGFEVVATLKAGLEGQVVSRASGDAGMEILAATSLARSEMKDDRIIIGFGPFDTRTIDAGIAAFRRTLDGIV